MIGSAATILHCGATLIAQAESSSTNWFRLLNRTDIVVPLAAMSVAIIAVVGGLWYKYRKAEFDAALKRDMIQRGMSVEEIERVLSASSKRGC